MTDNILDFHGITKTFFGVHALRDISLAIPRGHIMGLIGQNGAGKSTLMNILGGVIRPDSGEMLIDGAPYQPRSASDATHARIAFIHQELNLFTNLSIAENLFIDALPRRKPLPLIDRGAIRKRAEELLDSVGLRLAPNTLVEKLSPGERQLVEIMKALSIDANIIIFDEPTTSLTARETEQLFGIIDRLRAAGKTMIYISHILGDVLQIADDVAVLRDGELVAEGPKEAFDVSRMISLMVGRSIEQLYPVRESEPADDVLMQVEDVCQTGIVEDINFTLRKGEVLGVFGLMGSGRTELARLLFGLDEFGTGEVRLNGGSTYRVGVSGSIKNQIAFVTENRREEGLLMEMPIADNLSLVSLPQFKQRFTRFIRHDELTDAAQKVTATLQIKCGDIEQQPAKSLSGGNQQKVVIAKWLMSKPSIFIMDEPTRGIDVGAKYEIYSIINDLAGQGTGILFISSELEELMGMCDRILVMSRGEIRGEFARRDFNKENILRSAFREENGHESL
ncbi:sugar ABC transporter ATP-binding protein [Aggregatilinea lenta]|uniref:sugar ABC transporter ATP-binding protein n=1 Tax=Aggregatilinea lenta TaxID=913108 RepID=UPI000E5C41EA|nr:sugar ABC transporter ATP-binding protein [Aggregatilinea lenta]